MSRTFHRPFIRKAKLVFVGLVVFAFPGVALAQSVLTDDAQTSNTVKNMDVNFGSKFGLTVSPSSNV
jgi:hypothetical protein